LLPDETISADPADSVTAETVQTGRKVMIMNMTSIKLVNFFIRVFIEITSFCSKKSQEYQVI